MKKRLIVILMAILLSIPLGGCTYSKTYFGEDHEVAEVKTICNGYFTVISEHYDGTAKHYVVYATDTKVKYYLMLSQYRSGISPLYNADGTLQIYE